MELRDYLRAFRRRAWIPVAVVIMTVLTAGAVTFLSGPTYTATVSVFASAPGGAAGAGSGSQFSASFPQTVTLNAVAVGVIQKLKLNEPADQLIHQIRVAFSGTNVYTVSVSDSSPNRATELATEVAAEAIVLYRDLPARGGNSAADQALLKARDRLRQAYIDASTARIKFELQHPNGVSTQPNAPPKDADAAAQALELRLEEEAAATAYRDVLTQTSRQGLDQLSQARDFNAFVLDKAVARLDPSARIPEILFAAALALVAGIGLVFFLEHLDTKSVRESEAVEEMIGAPVIGIVPRATAQALRPPKEGAG